MCGSMVGIQCAPAEIRRGKKEEELECGPMPNVMGALHNIRSALCSTPQSLADAEYWRHVACCAITLARRETD